MKHILIVDDEEALTFAFQCTLRTPMVTVDTANSREEAFRLLERKSYDAVIADLRLTGVDDLQGLAVLEHARALFPEGRRIAFTAFGDDDNKRRAMEKGADVFMEKPVAPRKMKEVLQEMGIYE